MSPWRRFRYDASIPLRHRIVSENSTKYGLTQINYKGDIINTIGVQWKGDMSGTNATHRIEPGMLSVEAWFRGR